MPFKLIQYNRNIIAFNNRNYALNIKLNFKNVIDCTNIVLNPYIPNYYLKNYFTQDIKHILQKNLNKII